MANSVTVHMAAPAEQIWALVSDITNTGRFSPETFEAEWLDGASAPAVGVRFRGHVKRNGRGPVYWTVCKIIASEPAREFAFSVVQNGRTINTWRYLFAPSGEGTDVTESFKLSSFFPIRVYWLLAGWSRGKTNLRGMQATLERIKAVVETPTS